MLTDEITRLWRAAATHSMLVTGEHLQEDAQLDDDGTEMPPQEPSDVIALVTEYLKTSI